MNAILCLIFMFIWFLFVFSLIIYDYKKTQKDLNLLLEKIKSHKKIVIVNGKNTKKEE